MARRNSGVPGFFEVGRFKAYLYALNQYYATGLYALWHMSHMATGLYALWHMSHMVFCFQNKMCAIAGSGRAQPDREGAERQWVT
jgi:hypothetical protein